MYLRLSKETQRVHDNHMPMRILKSPIFARRTLTFATAWGTLLHSVETCRQDLSIAYYFTCTLK